MNVRILKAGIHRGEEPLVWGNDRSGMVVFSGCHLACSFCYTPETSVLRLGEDLEVEAWMDRVALLLSKGARNISLISPSHYWGVLEPALMKLKSGHGAEIPLVLKVSGYESESFACRMAAVGDVLVPDFKVWSRQSAQAVNLPASYGPVAQRAIARFMQTHRDERWESGQLRRGVIVRHLLMPGFEEDSAQVVEALGAIGFRGILNLMTHFIDPKLGLKKASQTQVSETAQRAAALGMRVLVDAKPLTQERAAG